MSAIDCKALLDDVFDQELGFRLTNFSIKPVHVANGLSRALVCRTYDTAPLNRSFRRYVRNQKLGVDQERNPNMSVLADYAVAFDAQPGSVPNDRKLTRLRALALNVFGADDGVYEQPDKSSFTLSNERFVTKDPSDMRIGAFLARLMSSGEPDGEAAGLLKDLLRTETDAWTTFALPLLAFGEAGDEWNASESASRVAKSQDLFAVTRGHFTSPTLRALRGAYDRLARFERSFGSKLNSLRRIVLFGCFVVHVWAVSRWSERDVDAPRPPLLLDLSEGEITSVRDASRSTLRASGDAIEGLIRARLREMVLEDYGSSIRSIEEAVVGTGPAAALRAAFRNYLGGGDAPPSALAHAVADAAFSAIGEHPIGALVELGRRAGFLSPWANQGRGGKLQKRYTATAEFLETLIAATVDPDAPLEFPEFLDSLRETFGIVVGRPIDDLPIRRNNLRSGQFGPSTSINEQDLRRNVEQLRRLIVESGYGKAYADGRTLVTTRLQGRL